MVAFTTVSCVESSSRYKALMAENDSLKVQSGNIENNYNETIGILNDVESAFQAIREKEGKMMVDLNNSEGKIVTKRDQMIAQVNQIQDILSQNRDRIAQLERKLNQSGKQNKILAETIERLQNELNEKSALIATLQEQLQQKDVKISELSNTINSLSTDVDNLNKKSEGQMKVIEEQDTNLNTVWYCVATRKELKEANIFNGGSVLTDKKGGADMNMFVKADMRKLNSIFLNSKSARILTTHPEGTYSFTKGDDKMLTLVINNPEKFWSISKYLVIKK